MRRLILALPFLLAACAHNEVPPIEPIVTVCDSASVTAEVEPEPEAPTMTDAQREAMDMAMIGALGATLAASVTLYREIAHPAWGRRQASRVEAIQSLC